MMFIFLPHDYKSASEFTGTYALVSFKPSLSPSALSHS